MAVEGHFRRPCSVVTPRTLEAFTCLETSTDWSLTSSTPTPLFRALRDTNSPLATPAARVSGLSVWQVKRLARRAADCGDGRVGWYAEHLGRLRRQFGGTPRGPTDMARARQAHRLRGRGLSWPRIARLTGYSAAGSGHSARKAVQDYRARLADGSTLLRARQAYQRRERGETWQRIAGRLRYASDRTARGMARRYAERAGLPWPVPIIEAEARGT